MGAVVTAARSCDCSKERNQSGYTLFIWDWKIGVRCAHFALHAEAHTYL